MWMSNRTVLWAGTVIAVLLGVLAGAAATHASTERRTGTIAFLRLSNGSSGGLSLFVIKPDGSGLRRLTPAGTSVSGYGYQWAPDGTRIAYTDSRGSLWVVHPDGTGRKLLVKTSRFTSLGLSWSPDSKAIAVRSPGAVADLTKPIGYASWIEVVPVDGGAPRSLPSVNAGDPAWSPASNVIAYTSKGGLWLIRSDGSKPRLVAHDDPVLGLGGPTWSPDGTKLALGTAIRGSRLTSRYAGIAVVDADGGDLHVITSHANNEFGFAWSPDGRSILYSRENGDIHVMDVDGRNDHRVASALPGHIVTGLAWSPDGRSIAYTAGPTGNAGNSGLFVIGADGRGGVRLTSSPGGVLSPSWVAR
jgi:Tol biopolymer transport system component